MNVAAYNLIVPVGTQVVTRIEVKTPTEEVVCLRGAVGTIAQSPTDNSHTYGVKLTDGRAIRLRRHEFSIGKHYQQEGLEATDAIRTS